MLSSLFVPPAKGGGMEITMENRYHYGNEADQYAFFQIPKILFTDPNLSRISSEAKVLLDRVKLLESLLITAGIEIPE